MCRRTFEIIAMVLHIFFIKVSHSIISFNSSYYFSYSATGNYSLTTLDVHPTHIASIGLAGTKYQGIFIRQAKYAFTGFKSSINSSYFQIRSFSSNVDANKGSFIVFDSAILQIYTKNFGTVQKIYSPTLPTTKIVNSCFGSAITQIFILIQQSLTGAYSILLYRNKILNSTTVMGILSGKGHDKMVYLNSKLYVSFQTVTDIYNISSNVTLLKSINYPSSPLSHMDISVDDYNLCYSVNTKMYLLSISGNYAQTWQFSLPEPITSIKLVYFNVFATSANKLYQVDHEANAIIDSCSLNLTGIFQTEFYAAANNIVVYRRNPNNTLAVQAYQFNYTYNCNSTLVCSCYNTYGTNNMTYTCQKYMNSSYNYTLLNIVSNATFNDTLPNQLLMIVPDPLPASATPQPSTAVSILNSSAMATATQVIGKSTTFASLRISPNFLLTFTGFLDDLWYYKYHRYSYPQVVRIFMEKIDIINQLRLNAWFLNFIKFISESYVCNPQNQEMYEYLNFSKNDPEQIYFMHSAEEVYKNNLIMNFLFWGVLKILHLIFDKLRRRISPHSYRSNESKLKKIVIFLQSNSRWWTVLTATLQLNMLRLTFLCFVQFLQPSNFYFLDKINLMVSTSALFVLITYCLCFYLLIYRYENYERSDILLTRCKHNFRSFYFQSQYVISRNFIRSLIHSCFISNYGLQISLLSAADIFFLFFSLKHFSCFRSRVIGLMCVLYSFIFVCFDLFFCLRNNTSISYFKELDEENTSFSILLVLAGTSLMLCFVFLSINIYVIIETVWKKFENNKIRDQIQHKVSRKAIKSKSKTILKKFDAKEKNIQYQIRVNKYQRNNTTLRIKSKTNLKIKACYKHGDGLQSKNMLNVNKLDTVSKTSQKLSPKAQEQYGKKDEGESSSIKNQKNKLIKLLVKKNNCGPNLYQMQLSENSLQSIRKQQIQLRKNNIKSNTNQMKIKMKIPFQGNN